MTVFFLGAFYIHADDTSQLWTFNSLISLLLMTFSFTPSEPIMPPHHIPTSSTLKSELPPTSEITKTPPSPHNRQSVLLACSGALTIKILLPPTTSYPVMPFSVCSNPLLSSFASSIFLSRPVLNQVNNARENYKTI